MRPKLVFVASLLAAISGSGTSIAIILAASSSLKPMSAPGALVLSTFLLPALTVLLASIFVYRHTARRRKLQAFLTGILSIILSLTVFITASILTARRTIRPPQPHEQRPVSQALRLSCATSSA